MVERVERHLAPGQRLRGAVDRWRSSLLDFGAGWRESEDRLRRSGGELKRLVWAPVAAALGGARRILIVPDGSLHLIPFAALPGDGGPRYLIEQGFELHYLVGERDLLGPPGPAPPRQPPTLLAVGGPDFDAGGGPAGSRRASRDPSSPLFELVRETAESVVGAWLRDPCRGGETLHFHPLSASSGEVEEIASIFAAAGGLTPLPAGRVARLTREEATEQAFRRLASRHSLLHLATHSFFDLRCGGRTGYRGVADLMVETGSEGELIAGLAFAGANRRNRTAGSESDGILTVEEIAGLDLSSVDWVVLSACETGLGRVAAGEGTIGLARGFRVAGAGSLVLSLWPVEDRATREWMAALYRARFSRGETKARAVHSAALETLQRRRREGLTTHPLLWAGFIGVGDWR